MGRLNVLLIKMSSLGDVIHTLPALQDAYQAVDLEVTWVVEPGFADIPTWHPAVKRVIPFPLRSLRKTYIKSVASGELGRLIRTLRDSQYDVVLDAQGLLKSAVLTRLAKGRRYGLDRHSARESLASSFYQHPIHVPKGEHAVTRVRQLFSSVFQYKFDANAYSYGLDQNAFKGPLLSSGCLLFLHGTTWDTKHWPVEYWEQLADLATQAGYQVLLPWGNEHERARAQRIQKFTHGKGIVLDKMNLNALAKVISQVEGVVAVDTGLGHLAAALSVPCVSLYGPTNPVLTRTFGHNQYHLSAQLKCAPCLKRICPIKDQGTVSPPCFADLSPEGVWQTLASKMITSSKRIA